MLSSFPALPGHLSEASDGPLPLAFSEAVMRGVAAGAASGTGAGIGRCEAAFAALMASDPSGPVEAMIAAHAVAAHTGAMECFRAAMASNLASSAVVRLRTQGAALMRTTLRLTERMRRLKASQAPLAGAADGVAGCFAEKLVRFNPMPGEDGFLRNGNPRRDLATLPRCGAHTRAGHPCAQPRMANGRCRMHGGKSGGAVTDAGKAAQVAAHTVHGQYGEAGRRMTAMVRTLVRSARAMDEGHGPTAGDRRFEAWVLRGKLGGKAR